MKKVELQEKDYKRIKELALVVWMDYGQYGDINICIAYVEAFKSYLKSKNLKLIDGVVYEENDNK